MVVIINVVEVYIIYTKIVRIMVVVVLNVDKVMVITVVIEFHNLNLDFITNTIRVLGHQINWIIEVVVLINTLQIVVVFILNLEYILPNTLIILIINIIYNNKIVIDTYINLLYMKFPFHLWKGKNKIINFNKSWTSY